MMTKTQRQIKYLHPEKYREFGLTVGLCACVQENAGRPDNSCEYCYGTGISVYTNIDIPVPKNCPHWVNDAIYVKGFRCSLYRDTRSCPVPNNEQCRICEQEIREEALKDAGILCFGKFFSVSQRCLACSISEKCYDERESLRTTKVEP